MIDFVNEIPPLVAGVILGSGLSLLMAALVRSYGRSNLAEEIRAGLLLFSFALLIIGTPVAALLSGISVISVLQFAAVAAIVIIAIGLPTMMAWSAVSSRR